MNLMKSISLPYCLFNIIQPTIHSMIIKYITKNKTTTKLINITIPQKYSLLHELISILFMWFIFMFIPYIP